MNEWLEPEDVQEVVRFQEFFRVQSYTTTVVLALAMLVVYALEVLWTKHDFAQLLLNMGANSSERFWQGEWWRLISSMFLHGGFLHFAMNTYVLVALGGFLNRLLGGARFLIVFVLSGICGSFASILLSHAQLSVGASGALWGLFGLCAALIVQPSAFLPELLRRSMRRTIFLNLLLNLGVSFLPMVDMWAHFGGGVSGFAIGWVMIHYSEPPVWNWHRDVWHKHLAKRARHMVANPLAAVSGLLVIMGVALAFYYGKPWQGQ